MLAKNLSVLSETSQRRLYSWYHVLVLEIKDKNEDWNVDSAESSTLFWKDQVS